MEIPDSCEFVLDEPDKIKLETQTNGDRVTLFPHLTAKQAASLAYFANLHDGPISVEIKLKED